MRVCNLPGLVLGDDPNETDNVGMAQVGHQFAFPHEILPRLRSSARFQRFHRYQSSGAT
jgi:hypothetical protein